MIPSFSLRYPAELIFGENTLHFIPERLAKFESVTLFVSKSATASRAYQRLVPMLSECNVNIVMGLPPEAPIESVQQWVDLVRDSDCDAVVAIGGGSVIDAAKTVAALARESGSVLDYFEGRAHITRKGLYFMAIPSTAGTGSEMTANAVLLNAQKGIKQSIRSEFMIPDVALIDPDFTLSCPAKVTAYSGLDAFTQAFESYFSTSSNPVCQEQAVDAIRLIFANLPACVRHPSDPLYRAPMAMGSMLSGMAFSQTGLGAIHGFAHPIGALLKIPHGLACAALLIPVIELNRDVIESRLERLAKSCGLGNSSAALIYTIKDLLEQLHIPSIKELGMTQEMIQPILDGCRSNSMAHNPRDLSDGEIRAFLEALIA